MTQEIALDYQPRKPFVPFHNRETQFGLMVCHRRAGKTVGCVGELVVRALHTKKKNAKFAYIGPFRAQAKETAWQYLKDMTEGFTKGPPRESELRVRLPNNATITIYGADNPDAFRGLYFDGVVIDEFGDCRATLWNEVILPALVDRNGWAVFIGTPKGKNHFYRMYKRAQEESNWYCFTLKASESGLLNQSQLTMLRNEMTEEAWNQEMECDFDAAVPGTYYAKRISEMEQDGSIGSFPYRPDLPVYAAADLGFSDSTAWWFWQVDEKGPYFINYEEDSGRPLDYYFGMLKDLPYPIDTIWLPHDAKATSLQTGKTTIEQFLAEGLPVKLVPKQKVQHGIDASRKVLMNTRIDETGCYGGIECLRSYRRRWNDKTEAFDDKPLHDWASNGADGFRYAALVAQEGLVLDAAPETPASPWVQPEPFTLNDLWEDRESGWKSQILRI